MTAGEAARPGSIVRVPEAGCPSSISTLHAPPPTMSHGGRSHSRNSSLELRMPPNAAVSRSNQDLRNLGRVGHHSRTASLDLRHTRNSSADLNKMIRNDVGLIFGPQGIYDNIAFVAVIVSS
jgi:hypothetical protein